MSTLKQFNYFICIVEHGSFSAASAHLYIAQSALSRQIKLLEDELGFFLFDRTEKKIQLTDAGKVLYHQLQSHLLNIESSIQMAQAVAHGHGRCLHFAHSSSVIIDPKKLKIFNALCLAQQIEIEIHTLSSEQQISAVLNGSIDIGFIRPPVLHTLEELNCVELYSEPLYVAVHQNNPLLAQQAPLNIADLKTSYFVSIPHAERGGLSYLVSNLCLSHGFYPKKAPIRSRKIAQLALVAEGFGICIVPEEFRAQCPSSVKLIPLNATESSKVCLIWKKQQDQLLKNCIEHIQQEFINHRETHTLID